MELLALNIDVIRLILSYMQPLDALRLAKTSHAAHTLALPSFLSEVVLDNRHRTERFSSYMLANKTTLIPCLRALTLRGTMFTFSLGEGFEEEDYSSAASIAEVIQLATRLRKVWIQSSYHYGADALLKAAPVLMDALATLPHLDDIHFDHADVETFALLSRMRSRPRHVKLQIASSYDNLGGSHYGPFDYEQDRFLENLTESLVTLELSGYPAIIEELEPDTVWPSVRYLELSGSGYSLSAIAYAFPNVRTIYIQTFGVEDMVFPDQWASLDSAQMHCPLPLLCPVRRLMLGFDPEGKPDTLSKTMEMLQATSPVVMSCFPSAEMLMLTAQSVHSLRFLQMTLDSSTSSRSNAIEEDLEGWVTVCTQILKPIPLRGLVIATQHSGTARPRDKQEVTKLAIDIAVGIPSLEYVGLGCNTSYVFRWEDYLYTWFRVASRFEDAQPQVEALTEQQGGIVLVELLNTPRA